MQKSFKLEKQWVFGALAIMLAALLWSLDGVFIRSKLYALPAALVVMLEHILGFLVLSPFIFLSWRKIKLLKSKEWAAIGWVAFFGGALGTIMITKAFFAAMDGSVTFATVVILQKLQPVFALLMARLILGERLRKSFYAWALVAIAAAYFLAFGKTGLNLGEINFLHNAAFYSLIAAFAFGSSTVFGKRIVNHLDFKSTAALRFGLTSLLVLVYALATGDLFKFSTVTGMHWQYLIIIVFTSGAAAMFIYYYGLKRVTASASTILELFWPFSAVILDYFINHNVLSPIQIVASLILFMAFLKIVFGEKSPKFEFKAKIKSGLGRGARLGFPTINLDNDQIDINYGLYLVESEISGKIYRGLLFYGQKETFNEPASLELYIKDRVNGPADKIIKIREIRKIREVMRFNDAEELKRQMSNDLLELERP
ncbi:EamA family transporter [Candidatus Falkowbacteria bacterium]|nr:EamA family transporter [Candidatus Falkowbacteria bacterium]